MPSNSHTEELTWADCYGGPADGEQIPLSPHDPLPNYPYLTSTGDLYWYDLYQNGAAEFRFFLHRTLVPSGWERVLSH